MYNTKSFFLFSCLIPNCDSLFPTLWILYQPLSLLLSPISSSICLGLVDAAVKQVWFVIPSGVACYQAAPVVVIKLRRGNNIKGGKRGFNTAPILNFNLSLSKKIDNRSSSSSSFSAFSLSPSYWNPITDSLKGGNMLDSCIISWCGEARARGESKQLCSQWYCPPFQLCCLLSSQRCTSSQCLSSAYWANTSYFYCWLISRFIS